MKKYDNLEIIKKTIVNNKVCLMQISSEQCSVCVAVEPKLDELLSNYPKVQSMLCKTDDVPAIAGEYTVFTAPTVLLFFEGREVYRTSRFIDFERLTEMLEMIFS